MLMHFLKCTFLRRPVHVSEMHVFVGTFIESGQLIASSAGNSRWKITTETAHQNTLCENHVVLTFQCLEHFAISKSSCKVSILSPI